MWRASVGFFLEEMRLLRSRKRGNSTSVALWWRLARRTGEGKIRFGNGFGVCLPCVTLCEHFFRLLLAGSNGTTASSLLCYPTLLYWGVFDFQWVASMLHYIVRFVFGFVTVGASKLTYTRKIDPSPNEARATSLFVVSARRVFSATNAHKRPFLKVWWLACCILGRTLHFDFERQPTKCCGRTPCCYKHSSSS